MPDLGTNRVEEPKEDRAPPGPAVGSWLSEGADS